MKKQNRDISSETINISLPTGWEMLSPRQARWLARLISKADASIDPRAIALIRFSGIQIVGKANDHEYLIKIKRKKKPSAFIIIDPEEFSIILRHLDWITQPLKRPWRPEMIAGRKTKPASLLSLQFGAFLAADNLYAGFLSLAQSQPKKAQKIIDRIADIILDGAPWWRTRPLSDADRFFIMIWFAAVKQQLIHDFPDFYSSQEDDSLSPENQSASPARLRQVMNAQIRALTKGDITKETQIMSMPTDRAMVELNALSKEYAELNAHKSK